MNAAKSDARRERRNATQRARRKRTGNADVRRYEKTRAGFLMRLYRNMQSRVAGLQWAKAHLYKGLPLLPRAAFYSWANTSARFDELWAEWQAAGCPRRLAPSVDRIDPERGYEPDNMEWVTHSENSRRGARSQHARATCRTAIVRVQW